jgi:hypothetical protein
MDKFKEFLVKKSTKDIVSHSELSIVIADVSMEAVGVQGNGKFVINNAFLGQVNTVIFSYCLLCNNYFSKFQIILLLITLLLVNLQTL